MPTVHEHDPMFTQKIKQIQQMSHFVDFEYE